MNLKIAQEKILKTLKKQNNQELLDSLEKLFNTKNSEIKNILEGEEIFLNGRKIQKENLILAKKEELEGELIEILDKYNLNEIAINIFSILEKAFSVQEIHKLNRGN